MEGYRLSGPDSNNNAKYKNFMKWNSLVIMMPGISAADGSTSERIVKRDDVTGTHL
jgi:hypothetical protein